MNHIQHFIELAIEGGWVNKQLKTLINDVRLPTAREMVAWQEIANKYVESIVLLDPLAWQAVGKALRWEKLDDGRDWDSHKYGFIPVWLHYWHLFIGHLAEGKSINESLGIILGSKE